MTHPCNVGTYLHSWIVGNATTCFGAPGPTWGTDGDKGMAE